MSIYTQLLTAAIEQADAFDDKATTGEALARMLECRARLGINVAGGSESGWAATAIADQLAYDVALINLARCSGIEASPSGFDPPQKERAQLERTLENRGTHLDRLFEPTELDARSQSSGG
jgi:hypothetical protein